MADRPSFFQVDHKMFSSPAYAAAGSAPAGGPPAFVTFLPMLLIVAVFYFLVIRPQTRRAKEHQQAITAVKKNDFVVTAGGIIGKVTKVEENEVEIEVASGVRVRVVKSTLAEIRPLGTKAAND
jgi:preprotein translocase subunit YajC